MIDLPFSVLKYLHSNLTHLVTTNEDKIDILDANRIPYAIKFNKEVENFFCVADENGYLKFFRSFPKLKPIKEIAAQKSCIYDLEWLNRNELACGGGDQIVSIYDVNTGVRTSILKGHTESVKSLSQSVNPFVIASGSRDGTILVYDLRCNKNQTLVEQIDNFSNEPNQSVTYIRSINSLQFVLSAQSSVASSGRGVGVNILKSKTAATLNSPLSPALSSTKRSSPVSCVLFQSENFLASAGATDGLIKVWDIRKLTSIKKQLEATPVYMLENQAIPQQLCSTNANSTSSIKKPVSKGYSNLLFNSTKTLLYANCMNNFLYEFNFVTYNSNHTRSINHKLNNKSKASYHINTSNFIRSSMSKCDNFLLTGSSDFNAYIYPTSVNNQFSCHFKRSFPAIVLKGHTNEVTAVSFNPLDTNQLVTCSDDNTIRIWNVKREIDDLTTKECNYSSACVLNEFENSEESTLDETTTSKELINDDEYVYDECDDLKKYVSKIRSNHRLYNKYRPHSTGVFDDYLFINYEYKNFMRKPVNKAIGIKLDSHLDVENELCLKCKQISFDKDDEIKDSITSSFSPSSPTSSILNSIEEDLKSSCVISNKKIQMNKDIPSVKKLSYLCNLPINIKKITDSYECENDISEESKHSNTVNSINGFLLGRRQASSSNLLTSTETNSSTLTNIGNKKLKAKSVKQRPLKSTNNQKTFGLDLKMAATPIHSTLTNTPNTNGKKRAANLPDDQESNNFNSENICIEPKTPQTKRRLIMPECTNMSVGSPSRTILHYFSPKPGN